MIDNLVLGLTHGLMLLVAFLLLKRPDLDREGPPAPRRDIRRQSDGEPPVA